MRIIITEDQEKLLEAQVDTSGMKDRVEKVNSEKVELENYIESHGEYMTDVTNGKTYIVLYLKALSELVGKQYAVCAPVRSDGIYGAFYVKPWETFIKKQAVSQNKNAKPMPVKKNLYQQMGFNK